jgi:multiple sugar transport system ATP-binding protein
MRKLEMISVTKAFGSVKALEDISFFVEEREFVVLVGPSGCGKSTLLRLIAGLEDISAGDLLIDERRVNAVPPAQRGLAMVFQSYALYPHMTVAENMSVGLRIKRVDKAVIARKVKDVAAILQLDELLDRLPRQLSGGQRQRVAIGRAIVRDPEIFLFDEPLSNLDAALRLKMRLEIAKLHKKLNATIIYVTHDQVEAMTLADKIVVLDKGRIEQMGTPLELYQTPKNIFVAGFLGSPKMNFLPGRVIGSNAETATVDLGLEASAPLKVEASSLSSGDLVTVGIRPESIVTEVDKACETQLNGTILVVEHLGNQTLVYVDVGDETQMTIVREGLAAVTPGATVKLGLPHAALSVFDSNGDAIGGIA